jgi:ABC-type branched-subunit amino acid transport system substrate-binding protein
MVSTTLKKGLTMKKFMFAFFAMVFAFVVGCGNSPEGAYDAFYDAAKAGDKEKLEELIDCNNAVAKAMVIAAVIEEAKSENVKKVEVKSVEEKGDTATLTLEDGDKVPLKKVDGKWKFDFNVPQM